MENRPQVRPEALADLGEAAEWYEGQREGLGVELLEEFERTLENASSRIETSAVVARTAGGLPVRRFRLERFSRYAIYLVVFDQVPVVVAFEDSRRAPDYWHDRLK